MTLSLWHRIDRGEFVARSCPPLRMPPGAETEPTGTLRSVRRGGLAIRVLPWVVLLLGGGISRAGDATPTTDPSTPALERWSSELTERDLRVDPTHGWVRGDRPDILRRAIRRIARSLAVDPPTLRATEAPRTWSLVFAPELAESSRLELIDRLDQAAAVEWAAPVLLSERTQSRFAPNGEIVIVADSWNPTTVEAAQRACRRLGFSVVRRFDALPNVFVVDSGRPARFALGDATRLRELPGVHGADPNWFGRANGHTEPNDPLFPLQWAHENTGQTGGVPGADLGSVPSWTISTGAPAVRIAVLDAGVDLTHPDLVANLDPGYDATDESPPTAPGSSRPEDFHGTACAGIAAASGNNGLGVSGVAWQCRVIPVRVGYGLLFTQSDWVIDAVTWAAGQADVITGSWGGLPATAGEEAAFENAVNTGRGGLGCVVTFSAGNGGVVEFPAAYPQTIAVGASNQCDERKSSTSCDGEPGWVSAVGAELDLVAPGVAIATTDNYGAAGGTVDDYLFSFSGTSAASPHVAGAAALLLSADPTLDAGTVRTRLRTTAADQVGPPAEDTPGFDSFMGHGRLDLWALLNSAIAVAPPTNLSCVENGTSAELTWDNEAAYDAVLIERDDALYALLPGNTTEYVDLSPADGATTYRVRGVLVGGISSPGASCTLFFLGDLTDLVWSPIAGVGALDSGNEIANALIEAGRNPLVVHDLLAAPPLSDFETVWVALGVFPETHALTPAESDELIDYLANTPDASLYVEGGDVWYLQASPELLNWFGVAPLDDGATDLSTVVGSGSGECDLSSFVILYEGDHASVDRLTEASPTASTVLENIGPDYGTAVFQAGGSYRTLGVSHEFGGLDPAPHSRRELISAYLLCFLGDPATHTMRAGSVSGGPGEEAEQTVVAATHLSVVGYQFGMTFDPSLAQVVEVTVAGTDAETAEFSGADLDNVDGHWTIGVVIDLMPPLDGLSPGYDFTIARARYEIAPTAPIGTVTPLSIPESVGEPPIQALFTWGAGQTTAPTRVPGILRVADPAMAVVSDDGLADRGATVDHFVRGSYQDALSGYAIGLSFDPSMVQATSVSLDDTVAFGAPFFAPQIDNVQGWLTAQILSDVTAPIDTVFPPAVRGALLKTAFEFNADANPGATTTIGIPAAIGNPLIATHFVDAFGVTHLPVRQSGQWSIGGVPLFIRGDANGSGGLPNIADAITVLGYLFVGQALLCLDAADVNDDGSVDVGDAIFVLNYQFISGPTPPAPFPDAGVDPTPDALDCGVGL